jgi:Spy/CpxP family protein refolding chaperone
MRNSLIGFLSLFVLCPLSFAREGKEPPEQGSSGKASKGTLSGAWRKLGLTEDQEKKLTDIQKEFLPRLIIARRELNKLTRQMFRLRFAGAKKRKMASASRRVDAKRKDGDKLAKNMLEKMKGVLTSSQRSHLVAIELSARLAVPWHKLGLTDVQYQKLALLLDKYTPEIDDSRGRHQELVRMYHEIATSFFGTADVTQLRIYQRQMTIVRNSMEDALEKNEALQETLSREAEKVLTAEQRQRLTNRRKAVSLRRLDENEER